MNPLYIDEIATCLNVKNRKLNIWNPRFGQALQQFEPRTIPYDSIIIQRGHGHVSFDAMNWLIQHNVSLAILDREGNIFTQILPKEPISNQLKIAQYQAYLDKQRRFDIARTIVLTKIQRSKQLLESLSDYFSINIPDTDTTESNYAKAYFNEIAKITKQLGFNFEGRNVERINKHNRHAADIVNALLNYSYGTLEIYTRRIINSIGLDQTIPFLHELRDNKTGLVYDLMELWRCCCDYSVIQTLEELGHNNRSHRINDNYEITLSEDTIKLLVQKLRLMLTLEEMIRNTRLLARYILGKTKKLEFDLRPIEIHRTDNIEIKQLILIKTAKELGINKSTLWYQKKRLLQNGSIRLYNKTRQYYA